MKRLKLSLFLFLLIFGQNLCAQNQKTINFSKVEIDASTIPVLGIPQISASEFKVYQMDITSLRSGLEGVAHIENPNSGFEANVVFPHPDGTMHEYKAIENTTMSRELAFKYPGIKAFNAHDKTSFVKWDVTQKGLHAMIMRTGKSTIFIDPLFDGNDDYYIVYEKSAFQTSKVMDCQFNSDSEQLRTTTDPVTESIQSFGTCELRTYRLAVSATVEYTNFHGGTVVGAAAAQVTTMNRVNGVYEKDMAITMTIIGNNDLLIFDSEPDGFTNGSPGTMISQNQSKINSVIGSSNYDIGHVFGTDSGGLANLGCVCSNNDKAKGVTGSSAPINDPFDIDYVAHEMGHQFGANHTFNNSCSGNRNSATAMEPGSGSTIMAYAGICAPNVQNNSDDHFHGISLEEIGDEIMSAGHQCEVITPLANIAPTIISTNGGATVPGGTPFALTAVVDDPDGDPISYNWEQMDNNISTQPPVSTSASGPNFRSWSSNTDPTRYFPKLQFIANNGPFTWEVLSDVSRTMDFRVTVRDNSPGPGGCNDHADVSVTVDGNSGPFEVLYPSDLGIIWWGGSNETVTWDVANTDNAPVSCDFVDILLSTDNGLSYPITLATAIINDGSHQVTVPQISDMACRIMVRSASGTFFDVSNKRFEIKMTFVGVIENVFNPLVNIYPNPSNGTVNVEWEGEIETIDLMDASGRVLNSIKVSQTEMLELNLSEYSDGMYFIHMISDQGRVVHNVIKQ